MLGLLALYLTHIYQSGFTPHVLHQQTVRILMFLFISSIKVWYHQKVLCDVCYQNLRNMKKHKRDMNAGHISFIIETSNSIYLSDWMSVNPCPSDSQMCSCQDTHHPRLGNPFLTELLSGCTSALPSLGGLSWHFLEAMHLFCLRRCRPFSHHSVLRFLKCCNSSRHLLQW